MAAKVQEFDFERTERAAMRIDSLLQSKSVATLQRAVVYLLQVHGDVKIVDGNWCLTISQRAAAAWCRTHAPATAHSRCHAGSLWRALQAWIARDVMALRGDQWWLSLARLRQWFGDCDNSPFEAPPPVAERCAPLPSVARCCALLPSVARCCAPSSKNERMNEEFSFFERENKTQSIIHSDAATCGNTRQHAATLSREIVAALAALPELPIGVWDRSRNGSALFDLLARWWKQENLADAFGPLAIDSELGCIVLGLIKVARKKTVEDPAAFFATSRQRPRAYVAGVGREWLSELQRSGLRLEQLAAAEPQTMDSLDRQRVLSRMNTWLDKRRGVPRKT